MRSARQLSHQGDSAAEYSDLGASDSSFLIYFVLFYCIAVRFWLDTIDS